MKDVIVGNMLRIIFLGVFMFCVPASAEVAWQQSESIKVQLGVRDKWGKLDGYDAEFIVANSEGKTFSATKHIDSDEFGYIYFPDDFGAYAEPGRYTWECIVNGEVIADGNFGFKTNKTHTDQANVYR